MDIFFDQDHLTLRSQVRSWVEKNLISARVNETDIEREAQKLVTQLSKEGFTAYVAAKRYGGVRESVQARDLCIVREELARGSALADTMFLLCKRWGAIRIIARDLLRDP